jgi:large subunit ribosomal protein L10
LAHIAPWKKEDFNELVKVMSSYPVIGIAKIRSIPAANLQKMRKNLRSKMYIKVSKNTLFTLALKEAAKTKKNVDKLIENIEDQVAIIATEENPFKLFREIDGTKAKSPAKGGEISPIDIMVSKGETAFKPGPIVSEMQKIGIPAGIDRGKVVIKEGKLLVKCGDRIPREMAPMLGRLEIYPLIVGLDLLAAYEDGIVYRPDVLKIDDAVVKGNITSAATAALNLGVFISYPTKLSIGPLIQKAHTNAFNLSVNANVPTQETIRTMLGIGHGHMLSLSSHLPKSEDKNKATEEVK